MQQTRAEQLQDIVEKYREAGESWPATMRTVAGWAIRQGHWKPHRDDLVSQCSRELADALREEYATDSENRRYRKKHAYTTKQGTFWVDIDDATPQQMEMATAQRRKGILGDCHQLKVDVDHYNKYNNHQTVIQIDFNFIEDLAEMDQPVTYAGKA